MGEIYKFCCSSELVLSSDLRQEQIYQSAQEGELFGTLKMNKGLTDNSDASQIVTKMAHFILIKFNLSSKVVYQSKIFYDRDNVLQQDDVIFVQIGQKCVQHEKLKAGLKVKVHVQFEVNRVNFCSMHYGVDHFNNIDLAFPPSGEPRFPKVRRDECIDMNPKQEAAARYIVGAGTLLPYHPGPTIISGPFGTGKTHAVAKIVMRLLLQSTSSKILIATHTNSAADWYITEHLHPLLTRLSAVQRGLVLRIYATMVDPKRVNKVIRENYALLDGEGCFRQPQLADVGRCRIVIATLSTAIHLVDLGELHGRFTHIFIDEAGQALEAEVMIPLGLASTATVVVLAGDHKQMKPKVYSKECQQRLFQRSMLERLIIWNRNSKCGFVQSLTFNYRMRPEILQFITKFYDGIPLEARGKNQPHPDLYPVSFYAVSGLEKQIGVSYVNALEAETIAILVKTLVESSWPTTEWGEFEASSVAVITPYNSQVKHIRNLLRQKKLGGITVERVQNMQGKQYRVVFISTVHTRNKLLEEVKEETTNRIPPRKVSRVPLGRGRAHHLIHEITESVIRGWRPRPTLHHGGLSSGVVGIPSRMPYAQQPVTGRPGHTTAIFLSEYGPIFPILGRRLRFVVVNVMNAVEYSNTYSKSEEFWN
ncbi:putative helicase with zinc finger domain 2 isoform X4 [Apostichopus japonicus]|uniref:Putative helicase with zinc finger domain 2 isoform X4 n=1 Tax=Stichopus japonicus TaxID=307972 RepID=A0A2G8KM27_STIJA|nr:putative helicase with zinc finger domain 2 isoform X4 [Apostichopus japonicus]